MQPNRISDLAVRINTTSIDLVVLNPGPTLGYITGLQFHLMERPTLFFVNKLGQAAIVLPELEASKVKTALPDLSYFTYGDDPSKWVLSIQKAIEFFNQTNPVIGVEPNRMRYLEMSFINEVVKSASYVSAEKLISPMRICKDTDEIGKMRKAAFIAEEAFIKTLSSIKIGVSERAIAAELTIQMLRGGSDTEMPFTPIVASGPNSANPHAVPSERTIQAGDLIVIDWGAAYQGYFSDITRTIAIGEIDPELMTIYQAVKQANQAGRDVAKPGIPAGDVDRAGRNVIEAAGYGKYFNHRIGHGLGLEAHEEPYMFGENRQILSPGMTFTVEPGIYLTEKGGVRIEDDVVVTESDAASLTTLDRELISLSGN